MWFIAFRQMFSKKKQTVLIFLGIMFGTMIYVIIAGTQYGMRDYLTEQLLNNTAHVIITGNERKIDPVDLRERFFPADSLVNWIIPPAGKREEARLENPQGWFERLSADPDVLAFAPRLSINAILSRGTLRHNVGLVGIIPERHVQVTSIGDYMLSGKLDDLKVGTNNVVLGSGVMESLGARVGQTILLSTGLSEPRPFKIVGVFELGNQQIDETLAFGHLNDVQGLNRTPGRVSEISISLTSIEMSQDKAHNWSLYSNDKVQGWEEANAAFMQVIRIQDIVRMVITGAILLVSAFGMYNVLSIMISQKQKEIAILRSIGYGPNKILLLILIQGLTLGISGGFLGLVVGHFANVYLDNIDLGFKIGKGTSLLISYRPDIYITAIVAALISTTVASILPARQAARLTPLEIIRSNL
ncbi:MAG: ABC transporter permease [Bdellovibrionaceae bacterium]|nr:ABC transporter permease [Pseudobdellovibrionaceae bacterium]